MHVTNMQFVYGLLLVHIVFIPFLVSAMNYVALAATKLCPSRATPNNLKTDAALYPH